MFKDRHINLTSIESRPSAISKSEYLFTVTTNSEWERVETAVNELRGTATSVTVLDNNPSTSNPAWFPRKMKDLDIFASRVLGAGSDLEADHPGFKDPVYRKRRTALADAACSFKHGDRLPRIEYTDFEIKTWGEVYRKLVHLYKTHACQEYLKVFPLLEENCGYREDNIPQLEDVSNFLRESTGFRLRPVPGLLSSRDFLAGLAFRVFHSTQYIRHASMPLYTPEPDVCHELLGHVPLFADKCFAEFSQEIGMASLGASDEDIKKLATCYWFTVEYGMCKEGADVKAFGAGLLSSFGELQYCLSGQPKFLDFEPAVTSVQPYPITTYQPLYFVAESFESAKNKMSVFASSLKKPFVCRYDALTETISIVDNAHAMEQLALSIKNDVNTLVRAIHQKA